MTAQLNGDYANIERARSALSHLDPTDRDVWVRAAMCIKDGFGDAGFEMWDSWGSQCDSHTPSAAKSVWRSVKVNGKTTIASLFYDAKQQGWADDTKYKKPTKAEIDARNAKAAERAKQLAAEEAAAHAAAAKWAQRLWDAATPCTTHPYLERKGVPAHGLRVGRWERVSGETGEVFTVSTDALLVPISDRTRKIWSLQAIFPNKQSNGRDKDYLAGGAKSGNFHGIGKPQQREGRPVFILAEGYATGASVHEATGHMVLVCFDKSGLMPVARSLRERQPDALIVIAADNDTHTEGNPGLTAARKVAEEVGGLVAVPPPGDFNDLQLAEGLESVASHILEAFQPVTQTDLHPKGDSALLPEKEPQFGKPVDFFNMDPVPQKKGPQFGKPVDLFNVDPVPQIPLDALPTAIASYAKDQAELMGCDHSILAMAALAAAASILDDGVQIQPKRHDPTWRESARLWVAVVGSPSSKKSPAIAKAIHPVRLIDAARREKSRAEVSRWEVQHASRKKSGSKQETPLEGPVPDRPPMKRAIVEDTTIEALSEILKDNSQGVLCVRDELTGWLGSMDAYKGSKAGASADRANWLELYNGGARSVDRLTRGSIYISNWSSCLIGGIQPDMLRRIVAGMGHDGLLQRFLPIIACSTNSRGIDREPDMSAIDRYRELFDQLAAIIPSKKPVQLEEEAHIVRERVDLHAEKIGRAVGHEGLEAWLGKWSGIFARLLLTFHAIECAQLRVYPSSQKVTGKTAAMVERLLCGTLLRHAINFYGEIVDVHDRHQRVRELARLVLAKGWDVVQKRELQRSWKAATKMQAWELHDVINRLCDMDWLQPDREDEPGADGKPRKWFVNSAIHEIFAAHANAERKRRAEVVETLRELKAAHQESQH